MSAAPALLLDGVVKNFGLVHVLRDVNITVAAGERHAIIGPNGAGKSTLFHMITGRFPVSGGRISLHGRDITDMSSYDIYRLGVARSFQVTSLFNRLSVFENLRVGAMRNKGAGARVVAAAGRLRAAAGARRGDAGDARPDRAA